LNLAFQRELVTQLEGARFNGVEWIDTFFGQQTYDSSVYR